MVTLLHLTIFAGSCSLLRDDAGVDSAKKWRSRLGGFGDDAGRLVRAIATAEPEEVDQVIRSLAGSRKILAPLGWVAETIVILFKGLALIVTNWRLTVVELVPAIVIGATWWDLKAHLLGNVTITVTNNAILALIGIGIVLITVLSYWCNAVFAFAVSTQGEIRLRPSLTKARAHSRFINTWGFGVGIAHALVSTVVVHLGTLWFTLGVGLVATVMMVSFVTVPARLIGLRRQAKPSIKDRAAGAAVSGTLSVVANTPGFLLDRLGLLLFSVGVLRIPALGLFVVGVALQAAAVSSVRAIRLSAAVTEGADPGRAIPSGN